MRTSKRHLAAWLLLAAGGLAGCTTTEADRSVSLAAISTHEPVVVVMPDMPAHEYEVVSTYAGPDFWVTTQRVSGGTCYVRVQSAGADRICQLGSTIRYSPRVAPAGDLRPVPGFIVGLFRGLDQERAKERLVADPLSPNFALPPGGIPVVLGQPVPRAG
ncbi:MAG: hypothetical protein KI785_14640 [Devosiaceae bacterium]|nr:hypothetical protein [Devosiaceae bacterium MH13]